MDILTIYGHTLSKAVLAAQASYAEGKLMDVGLVFGYKACSSLKYV
jgi:ABC-type branched-subunit amino acid transport system substrate-binding protein